MIDVRVREQDDVYFTEARIGFSNRLPRVVENPNARRILEEHGAVVAAQLALM